MVDLGASTGRIVLVQTPEELRSTDISKREGSEKVVTDQKKVSPFEGRVLCMANAKCDQASESTSNGGRAQIPEQFLSKLGPLVPK